MTLSSSQLGGNLPELLPICADMARRPTLSNETFDSCRDLVSQSLSAIEDEPMRMCNVLIREKFYPDPLGRNPLGTKESLASLTPQDVREHLRKSFTPQGALFAAAGKFVWEELVDAVDRHFGDWQGEPPAEVSTKTAASGVTHINKPTAQAQIALAFPAACLTDDRYYAGRVAEMVLSGGMGARLFTEVREKRALVYAVMARYHCLKQHAGIFVYAGTTPEKAQETLDVTVGELRRLREGVEEEEVARARTQLKSALVMQGESTAARSEALVSDYDHLGRLRSLAEISDAVDAVTAGNVLAYVHAFPADDLTALMIGPAELDTTTLT